VGRDELKLVRGAKLFSSGTLSVWVYEEGLLRLAERCNKAGHDLRDVLRRKLTRELNEVLFMRPRRMLITLTFLLGYLPMACLSLYFFWRELPLYANAVLVFSFLMLLSYDVLLRHGKGASRIFIGGVKRFSRRLRDKEVVLTLVRWCSYFFLLMCFLVPLLAWIGGLFVNWASEQAYLVASISIPVAAFVILSYVAAAPGMSEELFE